MSESRHGEQLGLLPYQIRCDKCGNVQTTSSEEMVKFLKEIIHERNELKENLIHLRIAVRSKKQINIDHAMSMTSDVEREPVK